MIEGENREDTIQRTADALGISLTEAEEIYAIEHGESAGDVVLTDDEGNPLPLDQYPKESGLLD